MASTPTLKSSGTQTATVNTEHYLLSTSDNGIYIVIANLDNMVQSDVVELRVYISSTAGATQLYVKQIFSNTDGGSSDFIKASIPIPAYHGANFTLKQTAGTSRSYQWEVLAL